MQKVQGRYSSIKKVSKSLYRVSSPAGYKFFPSIVQARAYAATLENRHNILIDIEMMNEEEARTEIGNLLYQTPATDKFENASRNAFIQSIVELLGKNGKLTAV